MKKRYGTDRAVPRLSRDALEAAPTRALLARLERLRRCEENAATSDLSEEEIASVGDAILFKQTDAWATAYREIKAILAEREHVERGRQGKTTGS